MSKITAAFTTRPGIAACHLDPHGKSLPLSTLMDAGRVVTLLESRRMSSDVARGKANAFATCARAIHGKDNAHALFVPGRIELLGKHTDYCGGRSLLCTVDRGFCFVAVPRTDSAVQMIDVSNGEHVMFELSRHLTPRLGHWTNYPMTVARRVAANFGDALQGCDIAFLSDLPPAAGLSSSSAFIVGMFLILSAVNNLKQTPAYRENIRSTEDLANYLGCCENGSTFGTLSGDRGVGTFGGSQDHTAILCCKPQMLSMYGFCPVRHEADVRLPPHVALHVVPSGVIAEKTGSAMAKYNAVSLRARKIVALWCEATSEAHQCLAQIIAARPDALARLRAILAQHMAVDAEYKLSERLDQFLIESNRLIPAALRTIGSNSWDALGLLVDESQALAETNLLNQVPETVAIQRQLRKAGAIAASAFGAGFGGSVWGMFLQHS